MVSPETPALLSCQSRSQQKCMSDVIPQNHDIIAGHFVSSVCFQSGNCINQDSGLDLCLDGATMDCSSLSA